VALYVNGKASTTYAVIGIGHGGRALGGVKGREVYLFNDGMYWVLRLFWLNLVKGLLLTPLAVFEMRRYTSQSDNQDLYRGDHHSVGSENPWPRPITRSIYSKSQVWNSA